MTRPTWPVVTLALAAALLLTRSAGAQTSGYALDLRGPETAAPADTITYALTHQIPRSGPAVVYSFDLPLGTRFKAVRVIRGVDFVGGITLSGLTLRNINAALDDDPVTQLHFDPKAAEGNVEIDVTVLKTWQHGEVLGRAHFLGTGFGSSNNVDTKIEQSGARGFLAVRTFVDLDGDMQVDFDDVGELCPLYIYERMRDRQVPDDVGSPTDPRLPLVTYGQTDEAGSAVVPLTPGAYTLLTGACDTPLPPSGQPQTAFELRRSPPSTMLATVSGNQRFEVQQFEVVAATETTIINAAQPVGAAASPSDLQLPGGALVWRDNAEGEDGYHVSISGIEGGGEFDLPPNSVRFDLPGGVPCGGGTINVSVTAVSRGAGGYPARLRVVVAADCVPTAPLTLPATGGGPTPVLTPWPALAAVIAVVFGAAVRPTVTRLRRCASPRRGSSPRRAARTISFTREPVCDRIRTIRSSCACRCKCSPDADAAHSIRRPLVLWAGGRRHTTCRLPHEGGAGVSGEHHRGNGQGGDRDGDHIEHDVLVDRKPIAVANPETRAKPISVFVVDIECDAHTGEQDGEYEGRLALPWVVPDALSGLT